MMQTNIPIPTAQANSSDKRLTFAEYLLYQDNSDIQYELFRQKLIPMPTPTALHTEICKFLVYQFQQYCVSHQLSLITVSNVGVRTEVDTSRIPDVMVCTPEIWAEIVKRKGAGVCDFGEAPSLVVEVTSDNWREDYIRKRAEYALIEILEYWIVDPNKQRVRICVNPNNEDGYEYTEFQSSQSIRSLQLPDLSLSVDEILSPPLVENLIQAEKLEKQQLEERLVQERQRAEDEYQRAEQERQRAERLAALLRQQGIDPDS